MRSNFRNLIEKDLLIWLAALIVVMAIILLIVICCYINFAKRRIVEPLKELTSKLENPKEWVEEQKKKQRKVAEEDQEQLEQDFDSNFAFRRSTSSRRARVNTEEKVEIPKIDEVQALKDLFLSIFDIQSDPKAEKLVKYYGYDTSVNPFIDYR